MQLNSSESSQFTQYYEEYKRTIFNYILYRVGFNHNTAEDLTSEIFLKAFEHFDSYDRKRSFKTWIFTIAHNHLVNYYSSKRETVPLDEAIRIVKEVHYSEIVDQNMTMEQVLGHIAKLPHAQRELIIMRYINELNNDEIAEVMGKDEGAIRTALSRALGQLRTHFNNNHQSH